MMNIILNTDSYKVSHWPQYPKGTTHVFSYMEPRKGDKIVWFGGQFNLKQLEGNIITKENIEQAEFFIKNHLGLDFFNKAGWELLIERHQGRLPVIIKSIPEGTVIPCGNAVLTIENTDPDFYWLTSYLETFLLHAWYPSTVATNSREIKKIIKKFLEETGDVAGLPFKLHDFGFRGCSSVESAGIGGLAHLVNFMGTDTMAALVAGYEYYNAMVQGYSIPAAEHSTITSYTKDHEYEAYNSIMEQFPTGLLAIVADSYDIHNAVKNIFGEKLFFEVKAREGKGTLIIRPDSGEPTEIVPELLELLAGRFGYTTNDKGYKVLPDYLRLIWGDGINKVSINAILEVMKLGGWSADNIAFGMGGALLQDVTRDDYGFAFKCSNITVNGRDVDVYKDPVTDKGKISKKGRLKLIKLNGEYKTVRENEYPELLNELITVFKNGEIVNHQNWEEIRQRAEI